MRAAGATAVVLASLLAFGAVPARAADDATAQARSHYEMGLKLFDAREHEQALIEFSKANEIKPRPAALFMMAQCEYLMGRLKDASVHYQRYATENPDGEFAELARDRVESIAKRPSTFVVNTVPEDVTVRISPEGETGRLIASGQAPNNFSIPRGRYRVDVTKPNYQGQTRLVDVDVGETKPLFFKLDPIPARLEIETTPPGATLYVNGNRARNPYRQDITPGHIEIFAEATDYQERTVDLTLAPGERKLLTGNARLRLGYVQRSGRPELVVASSLLGGLVGAGAVVAGIGDALESPNVASVLLVGGGAFSGVVAGALVGSALTPRYIPDNQALYILGGMWIGTAEGLMGGVVVRQIMTARGEVILPCPGPDPCRGSVADQLRAGFVGTLPGLTIGLTAGALTSDRAPNYGRVTLIQSAALGGALLGGVAQLAFKWKPYGLSWEYTVHDHYTTDQMDALLMGTPNAKCVASPMANGEFSCAVPDNSVFDQAPGALIGLNVGLAAGLLGAYLPDQSRYGPSWKRVLLVDLGAGAGALAGGVGSCVALVDDCLKAKTPNADARAISAWVAIAGGGLGALAGVLLTRGMDDDLQSAPTSAPPIVTYAPMRDSSGGTAPGVAAMGFF